MLRNPDGNRPALGVRLRAGGHHRLALQHGPRARAVLPRGGVCGARVHPHAPGGECVLADVSLA